MEGRLGTPKKKENGSAELEARVDNLTKQLADLKAKVELAQQTVLGNIREKDLDPLVRTKLLAKLNAGVGLSGGGVPGGEELTVSMGTPDTITSASTNSASSGTHTHAISGGIVAAYSASRTYSAGQFCWYNDNLYLCILAGTGQTPAFPSTSYWVYVWGKCTVSTSAPSGTPADGNIWLQRDA